MESNASGRISECGDRSAAREVGGGGITDFEGHEVVVGSAVHNNREAVNIHTDEIEIGKDRSGASCEIDIT